MNRSSPTLQDAEITKWKMLWSTDAMLRESPSSTFFLTWFSRASWRYPMSPGRGLDAAELDWGERSNSWGLNPSAFGNARGHWRWGFLSPPAPRGRTGEVLEFAEVGLLSRRSAAHALHGPLRLDRHVQNFWTRALFTSKIFCKIEILALSFIFDKYCLIKRYWTN